MHNLTTIEQELDTIKEQGRYRSLRTVNSPPNAEFMLNGAKLLNFSSNNYLGLANHPALIEASAQATLKWGVGSTASRLICGNLELHEELENELAKFKGTINSSALLFNSGYQANVGIIPALISQDDVIFSDEFNHASLIDGCKLSRAKTVVYKHVNTQDLANKIRQYSNSRRKLIVTDSIFSMDGDLAPLKEIVSIAEQFGAWVMVDEAHATGVMGKQGRGLVNDLGLSDQITLQMGTLSKALGSFGAFVVAPKPLIELIINRARSFIFTTSLPPGPIAAALKAIQLLQSNDSLLEQLRINIKYFADGLCKLGLASNEHRTPIFPIVLGTEERTMQAMKVLLAEGIFAQGIRPPTVAPGTCRLRLTVMATHKFEHLDHALIALKNI